MDIDITGLSKREINKLIQNMIQDSNLSSDEIIQFVKDKCQTIHLEPKTLGMLFELYVGIEYDSDDELTYFTNYIEIDELKTNIHPEFETSNGSTWARTDRNYLGKKYKIKKKPKTGKTRCVKLDGPNKDSVKKFRNIREDIKDTILKQRCRILDVGSGIEVDHKNGMYNNLSNISPEDQLEKDFQPLSKAANDAKREHCKKCRNDGKRYDARRLGYNEGWIAGDENTDGCIGCYWHDPREFNNRISKNFNKEV